MIVMIEEAVLEEALEALLTRVRWYVCRHYHVPTSTAIAFNRAADVLGKPNVRPYVRLKP